MKFEDINLDTWYNNRMLTDQIPAHFTIVKTRATRENMQWVLERMHGRFAIASNVNLDNDDFMSYYQKTFAFEDPKEAVQFELTWSQMFKCICHAVREGEVDRYHLIGTKCGKCLLQPLPEKKQKKFNKKHAKLIKRAN